MTRAVFNFSPGPALMPEPVLRQAAEEMLDWRGTGMSVMEMSHRGKEFISIAADAEKRLRELLAVPANYKLLFMQGGAIGENAIVPMNLLRGKTSIDFVDTGEWSKKSIKEAKKYATARVVASSAATGYDRVPPRADWQLELVAVLPGSRAGEVARVGAPFAAAIARIHAARPATRYVAPMVSAALDARFAALLERHAPGVPVTRVRGRSREVLAASDAVLVASGTATLECMLLGRPMVVGYRLAPLSHWLLTALGLIKVTRFALPNIVAGAEVVPEVMQRECTPERLAGAMLQLLTDEAQRARQVAALRTLRAALASTIGQEDLDSVHISLPL